MREHHRVFLKAASTPEILRRVREALAATDTGTFTHKKRAKRQRERERDKERETEKARAKHRSKDISLHREPGPSSQSHPQA